MGMTGISKSQVSRLCMEIDERVNSFLERPIEGSRSEGAKLGPYLWLDATYVKVRQGGRIVSVKQIQRPSIPPAPPSNPHGPSKPHGRA